VIAEQLVAMVGDKVVQRFSGEWAVGHDALVFAVVDEFPTFGIVIARADRLVQHIAEPSPTPDVASKQWLKSKWIKQRHS
jgi:hypothetical protein